MVVRYKESPWLPTSTLKMPVFLRKTLELDYRVAGDENTAGNEARVIEESWVMR